MAACAGNAAYIWGVAVSSRDWSVEKLLKIVLVVVIIVRVALSASAAEPLIVSAIVFLNSFELR